MVSRNLVRLFGEDAKSRWKIIVTAALVTAAVGMVADFDGKNLKTSEIIAAIAGGCFFLTCLVVYVCRR